MQEPKATTLVSNDNRRNSCKKGKVCPGVRGPLQAVGIDSFALLGLPLVDPLVDPLLIVDTQIVHQQPLPRRRAHTPRPYFLRRHQARFTIGPNQGIADTEPPPLNLGNPLLSGSNSTKGSHTLIGNPFPPESMIRG